MTTGVDVVAAARSWVGVPYRHQGRNRAGIDCIGLLVVTARMLGLLEVSNAPVADYPRRPRDGILESRVAAVCTRIECPEVGCVALIKWTAHSPAAHVGILTTANIIHAYAGNAVVVEHGFRGHWPARLHSLWRLPGIEPNHE